MKASFGTRLTPIILDQFAKWMPSWSREIRELAEKAKIHGISVEIKPIKPKRTADQNALYWSVVGALADYVGMSKAEMHDEILANQFGYDLVEFRGSVIKRPRQRSSRLSRQDFSPLIETAQQWAAEMGVHWEEEAA